MRTGHTFEAGPVTETMPFITAGAAWLSAPSGTRSGGTDVKAATSRYLGRWVLVYTNGAARLAPSTLHAAPSPLTAQPSGAALQARCVGCTRPTYSCRPDSSGQKEGR